MKFTLNIISFVLVLFAFSSCHKEQWDDCFTSHGKEGNEKRILPDFTRLEIGDNFHVILVQDSSQPTYVELIGGKNMFKGIHTEVNKGFLQIEDRNTCNFVRDFKKRITLKINVKSLNSIFITSATDLICQDTLHLAYLALHHSALSDVVLKVKVDEISVNSINSGSTTLIGKARALKGSIEEVTSLDASKLQCEEVLIDSHTTWDCRINASRIIYVRIYNKGNIFYTQTPSELLELNIRTGTGNLIKQP